MNFSSNQVRHSSFKEFVDSRVQTIPVTDEIISKIMPFFPKSARVIAGYQSEEQLYWKINYHWEVLLEALEHCLKLNITKEQRDALAILKVKLESNMPDPKNGYRTSDILGLPKDRSAHETILARHTIIKQAKIDFRAIIDSADIFRKTKRDPKALMLACAPVAKPSQSKHSTGFALDICGNNIEIKRIALSLGAVKPFDEGSHVHCEWPNGVDLTLKDGNDLIAARMRGITMNINNRIVAVRHCIHRMSS